MLYFNNFTCEIDLVLGKYVPMAQVKYVVLRVGVIQQGK
jgi:hypothetical protein